ncbi:Polygalacturonase ADPG1 [Dichanthelium oligosanthes]|uniref:Polygalacturonase ADPG1 n=1 Tax=Dichanthelium oligosanthes TaxID=888268 RepID=A0A1E5W6I5_9POAL|nr:Polygalacturonase ADPG1 [Dichanthelium oligosanthes]
MASRLLLVAPLLDLLFASGALAAASTTNGTSSQIVFSLDRYGARSDGRHDDTQALAEAWKAACVSSPRPAVVLIPGGDDCMSIENGTHNLHVSQVVCGPGHGISIGSLGDDNPRAEVSDITIDTVQLYSTTNGSRIQTYQGGTGYAKDITFQNMIMYNVKNPIIIDQNYCDKAKPCREQRSAMWSSQYQRDNHYQGCH